MALFDAFLTCLLMLYDIWLQKGHCACYVNWDVLMEHRINCDSQLVSVLP